MNLILLFENDFTSATRVRLSGRRLEHVTTVHRAKVGERLTVGVADERLVPASPDELPARAFDPSVASAGRVGSGVVVRLDPEALEMDVVLDGDPPPPIPVTLILALPRPKVLNRVIAGAASLGIKRILLINAWRVEKSYWKSPRLSPANLRHQSILGLEQARDTLLPVIEPRRFFRQFVEDDLPALVPGTRALVAHPYASEECPRGVAGPVVLVIGPEGGFIEEEVASLERAGCLPVTIGNRILRVETAVPFLIGRMF